MRVSCARTKSTAGFAVAFVAVAVFTAQSAFAVILPAPHPGYGPVSLTQNNSLQFGNFYVYSLQLLGTIAGDAGPGGPFYVPSDQGALGVPNNVQIMTGSGNAAVIANPGTIGTPANVPTVMDNAFSSPQGNASGAQGLPFFDTGRALGLPNALSLFDPVNPPPPNDASVAPYNFNYFTGDTPGIWTSQRTALANAVTNNGANPNNDLVFFFSFAQDNSGTNPTVPTVPAQDSFGWLRVDLVDSTPGGASPLHFYLTQTNTNFFLNPQGDGLVDTTPPAPNETVLDGGPVADPTAVGWNPFDPRWAHIHGEITLTPAGQVLLGHVAGLGNVFINQNLGTNQAAFGLFNPTLSDLVLDPNSPYDFVRIAGKMTGLDGSYEQLFIQGTEVQTGVIPEPASLLVWSVLGGLGIGGFWWRARRRGDKVTR